MKILEPFGFNVLARTFPTIAVFAQLVLIENYQKYNFIEFSSIPNKNVNFLTVVEIYGDIFYQAFVLVWSKNVFSSKIGAR